MRSSLILLRKYSETIESRLPFCINCVHFIENIYKYPYEDIPNNKKCKYFGNIDLVTGNITYELASICRDKTDKCGSIGQHFQKIKK